MTSTPGQQANRRGVLRGIAGGTALPALSRVGPLLVRAAPAVTVAPLAATGCVPERGAVQVVVVWSGRELELFRRTLEHIDDGDRPPIQLISAGNGIEALLRSRLAAGHPPNVAVLSRPGLLRELLDEHPDRVVPLARNAAADVAQYTPDPWRRLTEVNGEQYGVWLKAAHKSMFWHPISPELPDTYQPATLAELAGDLRELAKADARPLAIGAADGWVLTDWFENALLVVDPTTYDELAAGNGSWCSDPVTEALTWLAQIWRIPGVFSNGPRRALLTQYDEAALEIFVRRRGPGMTLQGDFVTTVLRPYQQQGTAPLRIGMFPFPGITPSPDNEDSRHPRPVVAAGDVAVLLRTGDAVSDRNANDLMRWLATVRAAQLLATAGFLPINPHATGAQYLGKHLPLRSNLPQLLGTLAAQLRYQDKLRFDLSDQLNGGLAGGDGQGMWRLLQDFFADVTRPNAVPKESVRRTQRRLAAAAEQNRKARR